MPCEQPAKALQTPCPIIIEAAKAYATLGEITDVMREVFGVYHEPAFV